MNMRIIVMLNNQYLYMGCKSERQYLTGKTDPSLRCSDLGKGKEISGIREILGFLPKAPQEDDEVMGGASTKKMMSKLSNWDVLFVAPRFDL